LGKKKKKVVVKFTFLNDSLVPPDVESEVVVREKILKRMRIVRPIPANKLSFAAMFVLI